MPIAADNIVVADGAGGFIGGRGTIASNNAVSLAAGAFTLDPAGNATALSFTGDGSNLTGLTYAQLSGSPGAPFNSAAVSPYVNAATQAPYPNQLLTIGQSGVQSGAITLIAASDATKSLTIQPSRNAGSGSNWTLELPDGPGNAGDVLKTDGGGQTSWTGALTDLQATVAALAAAVAAIQATLATGATGDLTPATGNLHATNGIVTAID